MYPEQVSIQKLEEKHPDVAYNEGIYECIDDFYEGGQRLYNKRSQYVKRKPDEDKEVYKFRLDHFTYDPIISETINKLTTRMGASNYVVEGIPETGDTAKIWGEFRKDLDSTGMTENDFIESTFEKLIKYKRVYAVLDFPEDQYRPNVILYDPRHLIHYKEEGGNLKWVKIRQQEKEYHPFDHNKYYIKWTIIDDTYIVEYRSEIEYDDEGEMVIPVKNGDDGKINRHKIDDLLEEENDAVTAEKMGEIEHGWGEIPVCHIELKDGLWVTNQAALLMKEHIRLHNNQSCTATLAGQIQRLFTPLQEKSDSSYDVEGERIKAGNEHILIGQDFKFNETQGSAVETVQGYLDKIENRIKDLLFSSGISSDEIQPSQESGVAKSLDFVAQEQALRAYGNLIINFYRSILRKTAIALGEPQKTVERINVNGLNEFLLDSLDNKIERVQKVANLKKDLPLSNKAVQILVEDLQKAMSPYADPDQQEIIKNETEDNFQEEEKPSLNVQEINDLVLDGVLSKKQALVLLGFDADQVQKQVYKEIFKENKIQNMSQNLDKTDQQGEGSTEQQVQEVMEESDVPSSEYVENMINSLTERLEQTKAKKKDVKEILASEDTNEVITNLVTLLEENSSLSEDEIWFEVTLESLIS